MSGNKSSTLMHAGILVFGLAVGSVAVMVFQEQETSPSLIDNSSSLFSNSTTATTNQPASAAPVATEAQELTDEKALELLNSIAHYADPMNPISVIGIDDDSLSGMATDEIASIIEQTYDYAVEHEEDARPLFILGRAALLHGDFEFALELLLSAAEAGSAAAHAYLSDLVETDTEAEQLLSTAIDGGFEPARDALKLLKPDFSHFAMPHLMEAFYRGETSHLQQKPLLPIVYISSVATSVVECCMLFLQDHTGFLAKLDASLPIVSERLLLLNSVAVGQTMNMGMNALKSFLQGYKNASQPGMSFGDQMTEINKGLLGMQPDSQHGGSANSGAQYFTLMQIKEMAAKDGKLLALISEKEPDLFNRIYQGMRKFVYDDMQGT